MRQPGMVLNVLRCMSANHGRDWWCRWSCTVCLRTVDPAQLPEDVYSVMGTSRYSPQPGAMPPAPAPAPSSSNNEARTIAIAVPVSIAIAIFCLGVLAGTCWMYRRQKKHKLAMAAAKDTELAGASHTSKGGPDGHLSDGMDDSMPPGRPVPMSATYVDVQDAYRVV